MAIYQKDVTKNIEPAMANPATMQQAGAQTRAAIGALAEGASAYYKGKIARDMFEIEQEATEAAGEFFFSNQAAMVAGKRASIFESREPSPAQLEFAEGGRGRQQEAQFEQQLQGFNTELTRLKNAAQGGMANEQYVARIDSITKKAIAQYPGLADDIRERVARVTGMPGADRWAQMEFVKDRFAKPTAPKGPTELDLAVKDMAAVGGLGVVGSQQELYNLYHTNRPEYNKKIKTGMEVLALRTQADVVSQQIAASKNHGDNQADQMMGSFGAIFHASLGASVLTNVAQETEGSFALALKLRETGSTPISDIDAWKTAIAMHTTEMRTSIERSRAVALGQVEEYIAKNSATLSKEKKEELRQSIIRQSDEALRVYADDKGVGLLAMANVLSTYRDKDLKDRQTLIRLAIDQQNAMQNNPLVTQYYQGGAARERLKLEQPFFHDFMVKQEQQLMDNVRGIGSMFASSNSLATVKKSLDDARTDGVAQEPPPDAKPEDVKAAHDAMNGEAQQSLKKLDEGKLVGNLEVNLISAALSTDMLTGAKSALLVREHKNWGLAIAKLPPKDIGIIKDNASTASVGAMAKVQELKQSLEQQHGVKLTLGVNDAGDIRLIDESTNSANKGKFNVYAKAFKEFESKANPILTNLVYGRSMLTGEDLLVISNEYAGLVNNNTPYKGFFSLKPKPVMSNVEDAGISQPATDTTVAPKPAPAPKPKSTLTESPDDELVLSELNKMKQIDPNLNVQYFFTSYQRATPKKKEELLKKLRDNNLRMRDISGG